MLVFDELKLIIFIQNVFPTLVSVKLATNYEKLSRQGTDTILLSKHFNCSAIDKLLTGLEIVNICF
jgi:hypothetical protein